MDDRLLAFTQRLIAFRSEHAVFRRRRWFEGRNIRGNGLSDIGWFRPDGKEMTDEDWNSTARSLAVFLNGQGIHTAGPHGEPIVDDDMLIVFNPDPKAVTFTVPTQLSGEWRVMFDTADMDWVEEPDETLPGDEIEATGQSLVLLSRPK